MNKPPLYYEDICLLPDNYSELDTRDNADTSVDFLGFKFRNPVILANMSSVVDIDVCRKLAQDGYCYSMHRFGFEENGSSVTTELIKTANSERWPVVSVSTGVGTDSYNDLNWMKHFDNCHYNIDIITVDVALGFHKQVAEVIKFIKKELPHTKIVAGNIAGARAAQFLIDSGADALKVGIGQGCFIGETKILMANGVYKNIKEVSIGEYVINMNGVPVKVLNKINTGFKKCISTKNNSFYENTISTPEHQYWIGDLSTTKIKDNCIDAGIATQLDKKSKTTPKASKYKWQSIGDINNKNQFLLLPNKYTFDLPDNFSIDLSDFMIKGMVNETNLITNKNNKFNRILFSNYNLGYIFGTFLGDGTSRLYRGKDGTENGRVSWAFGLHETDIAEKLKKTLIEELDCNVTITPKKSTLLVNVYNKCLTKCLVEFGKRQTKNLPSKYYSLNKEYVQGIFDGLIDSDGCISDKTYINNTSSKIHEVFYFCCFVLGKSFGSSIRIDNTSELVKHAQKAYDTRIHKSKHFTKNFSYVTLNDTRDLAVEVETWDIEVDCPTHSFIANNVIVHNSVCSTKLQTGFTAPMLWSLHQTVDVADKYNVPVIADGGIKNIGDIAKALVFGAKMVMCGGLFAPCIDSAAKINNEGKKEYFGSASFHCKKHDRHLEGFMVGLEADKTILEKMNEINQALASSISYAGGNNISDLKGIDYLVIK